MNQTKEQVSHQKMDGYPVHACKPVIFLLMAMLFWLNTAGQDTIPADWVPLSDLSEWIEDIAEKADAELDYTELIERLSYLRQNPLNLNYATGDDLRNLIFLNEMQVFHLLAYRETYGYFVTIYELQAVEGFDQNTIKHILPFVTVTAVPPKVKLPMKNVLRYGKHTLLMRYQQIVQDQQGYLPVDDSVLATKPNSRYMGGPEKILSRYRFQYGDRIRFGITAEKDAGEPFFSNRVNPVQRSLTADKLPKGFDFYSFHFNIRNIGRIKTLSIGDYQLRFGQGLTMWQGLAFGKSSDISTANRHATGLRPYASSDENRFFRGGAMTINLGKTEITGFFSDNKVDANMTVIDNETDEEAILTFQETGLHRTPNEILKKNIARVMVTGGNLTYRHNRLKIGLTGFYTRLGAEMQKGNALYQKGAFSGKENINAGIDYGYIFQRINFFGEVASDRKGSVAQLHGLSSQLHPRLFLSLIYRNYAPDYQNFFANGLSESNTVNEEGFYSGIRVLVRKNWTSSGYIDLFSYPWLRYRVNKPTSGSDFYLQLDHSPSREVLIYFRFRQKTKQINSSFDEIGLHPVAAYRKSNFRTHLQYTISPFISMANRLEYILLTDETGYRGTGYLVYQDISYNPERVPLRFFFRYALFDTDSYDERVYAYENDVLYAFSVPAYYYKGSKTVVMLRYNMLEKVNLWLRLSHILFVHRDQIGSGLELIDGNQKTEVKLQIQIKL